MYRTPGESADLPVTDLVSVRFEPELPMDSALALLATYGLRFVDSSEFRHNLWRCALDDAISESPLGYGNALHFAPGVLWACAALAVRPVLAGPTDPYYEHQYYLKNTGQDSGTAGIDIAVEQAWQVPLMDPTLRVAVIDDGLTAHTELSWPRLRPGYDFVGEKLLDPLQPDSIAKPGIAQAHGMACTGILAAAHNGTGVVGVCGTCEVVPIKVTDNDGIPGPISAYVNAIYYAQWSGARVVSNSWDFHQTLPVQEVADAIRDVTGSCVYRFQPGGYSGAGQSKDPEVLPGLVMVFAAGNAADGSPDGPAAVHFPANMPEVIAVGAVSNTGVKWDYSCYGSALDVVAPSGNDEDGYGDPSTASDQWSVDQMADSGWNPRRYPSGDADDDWDYTSHMGGTSGACPQVAGIAALLLARGYHTIDNCHPGPKILEIIDSSAVDLGRSGRDDSTGYGLANAYRAMLSLIHGDFDNSGQIDTLDARAMERYCFRVGPPPTLDQRVSDTDCDGDADIFDFLQTIDAALAGPFIQPCFRY